MSPRQVWLQSDLHRKEGGRPACVAGIECLVEVPRELAHSSPRTDSSLGVNASSLVGSRVRGCRLLLGIGSGSGAVSSGRSTGLMHELLDRWLHASLCGSRRWGSSRGRLLRSQLHVHLDNHVTELRGDKGFVVLTRVQLTDVLAPWSPNVLLIVQSASGRLHGDLVNRGGRCLLLARTSVSSVLFGPPALNLVLHEGFNGSVTFCRGERLLAVVVEEGGEWDVRVAVVKESLFVLLEEVRTKLPFMGLRARSVAEEDLVARVGLDSLALGCRFLGVKEEVLELGESSSSFLHSSGGMVAFVVAERLIELVDNPLVGAHDDEWPIAPANTTVGGSR